jgi:hypothetical protein
VEDTSITKTSDATGAARRPHYQELSDLVHSHAAANGWRGVTYQAAFVTVIRSSAGERWIEGNSGFWDSSWNTLGEASDHRVEVKDGEAAWRTFLKAAKFADLQKAETALSSS